MKTTRQRLKPFFKLFIGHWKGMFLGTLMGVLAVSAAVGLLALSGWFISATAYAGLTLATAQRFNFFHPSIGVRLFAMIRTAGRYAERIVTHNATFKILESLRVWFYRQIEPLAPSPLMRRRSGDLLNRLVMDIDALDHLYLRVISPLLIALVVSLGVILILGRFDAMFTLIAALFLFAAGVVVPGAAGAVSGPMGRKLLRRAATLRIRIVEGLEGMSELMVFGARRRHLRAIARDQEALIRTQKRMQGVTGFTAAAMTLLSGGAALAVLYHGTGLVNMGAMGGEMLALLVFAVLAAFEAVMPLPTAFQYWGQTREAGSRVLTVAETNPDVLFPLRSMKTPQSTEIQFHDVSFRYTEDDAYALAHIRLHLPAGCRAAVVGATGSGKSTLLNLLVRFRDPSQGRITFGGVPLTDFSEADLRRLFAVVPQQGHLFHASLRHNLELARPGATDAQLWAALESAKLAEFVHCLPEGLETVVGESGRQLSGGQAQRLAVARAVLRDAPVWLLDEPTEGLDRHTERELLNSIFRLTAGRTVLFITHRLTDLHRMDRIFVMSEGKITAQGTHDALMRNDRGYRWIYE